MPNKLVILRSALLDNTRPIPPQERCLYIVPYGCKTEVRNYWTKSSVVRLPYRLRIQLRIIEVVFCIAGVGWRLLGWGIDPLKSENTKLSPWAARVRDLLSVESVQINSENDATGDWAAWFEQDIKSEVVLVRPDFYIGDACSSSGISDL